ncbi:unnamed protein product [Rangifer tarandus platyrhynchus]|uniref:Uncharacterized protein n=2 Tax=Rangifer tarandus platyrhynchus TaxID=3082113 RepID=A0ABN8ZJU0_RANTA|nr:unnamed protein product [Rangifer tarandus platyrhynchus]CAI9706315.1 unnamed protein product [Rangifer tarandus platyrhynchus]
MGPYLGLVIENSGSLPTGLARASGAGSRPPPLTQEREGRGARWMAGREPSAHSREAQSGSGRCPPFELLLTGRRPLPRICRAPRRRALLPSAGLQASLGGSAGFGKSAWAFPSPFVPLLPVSVRTGGIRWQTGEQTFSRDIFSHRRTPHVQKYPPGTQEICQLDLECSST